MRPVNEKIVDRDPELFGKEGITDWNPKIWKSFQD